MKSRYPKVSLVNLCRLFGYTRQAYYKRQARSEALQFQSAIVVDLIQEFRKNIPGIGGKKLYFLLKGQLVDHGFKIGRDHFFQTLRANQLLLKHYSLLRKQKN